MTEWLWQRELYGLDSHTLLVRSEKIKIFDAERAAAPASVHPPAAAGGPLTR
jgi:hypothetical protein